MFARVDRTPMRGVLFVMEPVAASAPLLSGRDEAVILVTIFTHASHDIDEIQTAFLRNSRLSQDPWCANRRQRNSRRCGVARQVCTR